MQAEIRIWFSKTSKFNVHLPKLLQLLGVCPSDILPGLRPLGSSFPRLPTMESKNTLIILWAKLSKYEHFTCVGSHRHTCKLS